MGAGHDSIIKVHVQTRVILEIVFLPAPILGRRGH
jgi:hypothetical protein